MTYLEAADWLMRLQGEKVPQAEVDGWLEWSHADPHNLDTFDRMQSLYAELRTVADATRRDFCGWPGVMAQRRNGCAAWNRPRSGCSDCMRKQAMTAWWKRGWNGARPIL